MVYPADTNFPMDTVHLPVFYLSCKLASSPEWPAGSFMNLRPIAACCILPAASHYCSVSGAFRLAPPASDCCPVSLDTCLFSCPFPTFST